MRDSLLQRFSPKEKDLVERIRGAVKGQNVEDVLRRFAKDNKDLITEDELLLALSRLNANIYLGDIKDLVTLMKAGQKTAGEGKVSIAEATQLIGH